MRALGFGMCVIAAVAASALLDEESGVAIWLEMRESLDHATARVAVLERQNDSLRSEIGLFETEPATVERAIREELDLALPGETVVYFSGPRANGLGRRLVARRGVSEAGALPAVGAGPAVVRARGTGDSELPEASWGSPQAVSSSPQAVSESPQAVSSSPQAVTTLPQTARVRVIPASRE